MLRRNHDGRLQAPNRSTPQPVGRQDELCRGANVRDGRVVEGGADPADDPAHPRDAEEDRGDDSADHPRKSCREHEREREDHDALTNYEAKKLERMRRLVTTHGLDGDELDHGRGEAVRDDDRDQADPLPEDVFGARDRPRENRERDPRLELARNRWRRDENGGQRENPAEHEHHEDQELRDDRLLLRVREGLAGVPQVVDARHSPDGQGDHHESEQYEREQEPAPGRFAHDLPRHDEHRPHVIAPEGSGSVLRAIRAAAQPHTRARRRRPPR